jgi:hypothetical protein
MKRLTIAELRSQKVMGLAALECIKGGNTDKCHSEEQVSGGIVAKPTKPGDRIQ